MESLFDYTGLLYLLLFILMIIFIIIPFFGCINPCASSRFDTTQPSTHTLHNSTSSLLSSSSPKQQQSSKQSQEQFVSILTLNCCLWPPGLRNTKIWPLKDTRCPKIAELFSEYDLCVCQELFTWPWLTKLIQHGCKWRDLISRHSSSKNPPLISTHDWVKPYLPGGGLYALSPGMWTVARKTRLTRLAYRYIPYKHIGFVAFEYVKPNGYQHSVYQVNNPDSSPDRETSGTDLYESNPRINPSRDNPKDKVILHVFNTHLLPSEGAIFDSRHPSVNREAQLKQLARAVRSLPCQDAWLVKT